MVLCWLFLSSYPHVVHSIRPCRLLHNCVARKRIWVYNLNDFKTTLRIWNVHYLSSCCAGCGSQCDRKRCLSLFSQQSIVPKGKNCMQGSSLMRRLSALHVCANSNSRKNLRHSEVCLYIGICISASSMCKKKNAKLKRISRFLLKTEVCTMRSPASFQAPLCVGRCLEWRFFVFDGCILASVFVEFYVIHRYDNLGFIHSFLGSMPMAANCRKDGISSLFVFYIEVDAIVFMAHSTRVCPHWTYFSYIWPW